MTWTRYTTAGKPGSARPTAVVELGPGDVQGLDRRLIGSFEGKRILELGTGVGHSAIAMAAGGARTVAIDPDEAEIAKARSNAEKAGVHVEFHIGDLADLAFLQADIFDVVVSVHALAGVEDLSRVFRQVHRVLKPDRPLVFSLPHPIGLMTDPSAPTSIVRSHADPGPLGKGVHLTHPRTISQVFTHLTRANYRVDALHEPLDTSTDEGIPASVIFRARKVGT